MSRARATPAPVELTTAVSPHVIHPTAAYTVPQAQAALGLRANTIRREVREGRLRVSRRAGKYLILGAWLLSWIEGGEIRRGRPKTVATANEQAGVENLETPPPHGSGEPGAAQ